MNPDHWLAFTLATFIICIAPGPNMLQMMSSGAAYGFRRSVFSMAGCFLGVLLLIAGSVAGVGLLLQAMPQLYTVLCYVGAAYLCYLGVQSWRVKPATYAADDVQTPEVKNSALFYKGFMVAMSNPKALLFAAAFFPQFVDPALPQIPQLLILLTTFAVLEIACYSAYALGGSRLTKHMGNPRVRRNFNRVTGAIFIGFSVVLLVR